MTPSSRRGSLAWAAAALVLFVLGCNTPISATAAFPGAGSELLPAVYVPADPAPAGGTGHSPSHASFGQVDVFIDLACEKSAAAWPTLKRIVKNQRHRVDFVFHILPLSEYPIGFFAAKAVQVILANSEGTYDDVEPFIDWVFRGQRIILYEEGMDMTLDAREVVTDWALSTTSLSPEKLYSDLKDPAFDQLVLEDLDTPFLVEVEDTPTALFNGIFMMQLEGEKQLRDYEIFLDGIDFDSAYDEEDDDGVSSAPMWMEIEQDMKDEYEEMQRKRKAQQVAREQRKFEQVEMRAHQQRQGLGVLQQEQLKQLLHLQQDQLTQLLLRRDTLPADFERASPSSSSALGFSTLSFYALSPEFDQASSSSPPFFFSSSSSSSSPSLSSPPARPYSAPTAASSPSQAQSSWSTFFSFHMSQKAEDPRSAGDGSIAEVEAFEADWAAKRHDQQQHLRQHRHQHEGLRLGNDLLSSFVRFFFWPESVVATSEEIVQEGSRGAGGREPEGGAGPEVGEDSIKFEAYVAANVVAVKP